MGKIIRITSTDGFEFDGYLAEPDRKPRGAIMVIQEIFGVNQHIREVTDGYAESGYVALAPAIFDRAEANVELAYDQDGITRGAEIARGKLHMPDTLNDLSASVMALSDYGKVGAVGYCFGGMLAYICASQVEGLSCSVGYYGGGIAGALDQQPTIPVILHFGELDAHIPMSDVEKIRAGCPDIPVYTYDADHGFNCDHRDSYNAAAADLALERSLAFFEQHLGG
jgi:carboxymethylenebutenolidase